MPTVAPDRNPATGQATHGFDRQFWPGGFVDSIERYSLAFRVMWPNLTDDDLRHWKNVATFAGDRVLPNILDWDRRGILPREFWKELADQGLLGLPFPKAVGGAGGGALRTALAIDGFAYGSKDLGIVNSWGVHTAMVGTALVNFGSPEQRSRYLPAMAAGDMVAAFALTEPEAGSHAASMRTSIRRDGGDYIVSGNKSFVTNAPDADLLIVVGRMDDGAAGDNRKGTYSALIVERDSAGLTIGPPRDKSCIRTSPLADVELDECRVPADRRLGDEGRAFETIAMSALDWDRCVVWAGRLGRLRTMLEDCLAYSMKREQFGRPIARHQTIAFKLADMKLRLNAAEALMAEAISRLDQGKSVQMEASIARLYLGEATMASANDATQIFGGAGFYPENHVERYYRDAKLDGIGGGTSEIQRLIISRELLNPQDFPVSGSMSPNIMP